MIAVHKEGIVLDKTDLEFENEGVLNPAILQEGNSVHVFYRAVRKGNHSTIGYCLFDGPLKIAFRSKEPLLVPETDYESVGLEDARVVEIEGKYYMTYTAYDGWNALGCLAVSDDLKTWEKKGFIVPYISYDRFAEIARIADLVKYKYLRFGPVPGAHKSVERESILWDKNTILFPRKINGKFVFFHRIYPDIQVVKVDSFDDLTPEFWENYLLHLQEHIVMHSRYEHEFSYLGGGCPPIESTVGWVVIYHGVRDTPNGYVYSACAALLDTDHPERELARLPYALFTPEIGWEQEGYVNNVCFPTGTALFEDTLYIYYGAADERIACASLSFSALVNELVLYIKTK